MKRRIKAIACPKSSFHVLLPPFSLPFYLKRSNGIPIINRIKKVGTSTKNSIFATFLLYLQAE
ncbi:MULTISPECIES: hypothetical protein [unclassified Bacteroides]|jgi:hypothetical protein|uniref:hypothetical protein n=1 Tax=unclassified Bacteroides TaxID=2646097 RepID=UPI0011C174E5|nr:MULTISPECIES: hypothetical protein [unclassified Bacteroides]